MAGKKKGVNFFEGLVIELMLVVIWLSLFHLLVVKMKAAGQEV